MDEAVKHIEGWAQECIADQKDLFIVDIIKKGSSAVGKVIILIDGDQGVPIEVCAKISRTISRRIDEELDLQDPLTMEVSSPGLDHPLKMHRQYVKNIGKSVRVNLNDQSQVEGELTEVSEDAITLVVTTDKKKVVENREIKFSEISKTIVLVSFK
ncbi:ribosome maturation factor RimP [Reichenbachiella agariperforans]|uniref:ribosome maturation factor RimP n=1 Tax=Reichenbachiella agariperforans TaxID=156994 RepID=UPI001C090B6D|nr:ribosome maturation factor RimP [Reichenbachiella agariperforans]